MSCETPQGELWTYGYDPLGRRSWKRRVATQRTERGPDGRDMPRPPVGTCYAWDGDLLAEEAPFAADGTPDWARAVRWHYEPGSFRPLAREDADGALSYLVTDHLGTPREMLDETGKLVWAAEYRVWGGLRRWWAAANDNDPSPSRPLAYAAGNLALAINPDAHIEERAAAQLCPIRFQGQWADEETGLNYNYFRHYDTLTGQYVSRDPIGLRGGTNCWAYTATAPTVFIDPFGLAGKTIATTPNGDSFISGFDPVAGHNNSVSTDDVRGLGNEAGWQPENAGAFDRGEPGRYYCCHAEQKAITAGNKDVTVDNPMCSSCQGFSQSVANHTGEPITVTDPNVQRVFNPNGTMTTTPR